MMSSVEQAILPVRFSLATAPNSTPPHVRQQPRPTPISLSGVTVYAEVIMNPRILPALLVVPAVFLSLSAARPPSTDVTAITQQWARAWNAKQLDATLELYAPDAVFLTAEGGRYAGQPAIRKLFQQGLDSADPSITLHTLSSSVSSDLAYDSGEFTEILIFTGRAQPLVDTSSKTPPPGTKLSAQGYYLIVFRRQPDGQWRIAQHMWSFTPPATK
jgi:ketosteroid isomerase-like protein